MIQREWKPIPVRSYDSELDSYGQLNQNGYTEIDVPMVVKIYSQDYVSNPLYNDVELICLVDREVALREELSDKNTLVYDLDEFQILHLIPSSRYTQILCKKMA